MASSNHFADRLRSQLNDVSARNLELQAQLAHKEDVLAATSSRLQTALSSAGHSSSMNVHPLQQQLQQARDAAATSNQRLQESCFRFGEAERGWKTQIKVLQASVDERDKCLRDAEGHMTAMGFSIDGGSVQDELMKVKAELVRVKAYAAGLERQFAAEKKANSRTSKFPTTAAGKGAEIDQDDEEVIPDAVRVKMEMAKEAAARKSRLSYQTLAVTPQPMQTAPPMGNLETPRTVFSVQTTPSVERIETPAPVALVPSSPQVGTHPHATYSRSRPAPPAFLPLNLRTPSLSIRPRLSTTNNPRASSISSQQSPPKSKRKRMVTPDSDASFEDDCPPTPPIFLSKLPKRRRNNSQYSNQSISSTVITNSALKDLKRTFQFKAITSYDGDMVSFHSAKDLADNSAELWERILKLVNSWEEARGTEWRDDICEKYKVEDIESGKQRKPCVSMKLLSKGGRLTWRAGEDARWACRRCVEADKPCFTWDGTQFWLLPLHEEDREFEVKKGFEIRTWLNVE